MVYAFEPQRILHQILCSNFAMNGAFNCHCRLEALGQQAGDLVVPPLDINQEGCHGATSFCVLFFHFVPFYRGREPCLRVSVAVAGCTALDSSNFLGETVKACSLHLLTARRPERLRVLAGRRRPFYVATQLSLARWCDGGQRALSQSWRR
jgi:hypothetical protein